MSRMFNRKVIIQYQWLKPETSEFWIQVFKNKSFFKRDSRCSLPDIRLVSFSNKTYTVQEGQHWSWEFLRPVVRYGVWMANLLLTSVTQYQQVEVQSACGQFPMREAITSIHEVIITDSHNNNELTAEVFVKAIGCLVAIHVIILVHVTFMCLDWFLCLTLHKKRLYFIFILF